ncbi:KH domain-containing, RNA-binding, signal transduction-associated protein 2-like [Acanthaster planci]|uniref:KH domain-containing, RNA-binding, signal transduction-associated protein 2-like n=1 Tax=Acanthaster planci TaxID=133434 RepID=A0A8B7ZCD5_ACAPL|nr:KH domain-containing, RNA-binding, signal transduction-associated protein 2-like [Acanthaster planci]
METPQDRSVRLKQLRADKEVLDSDSLECPYAAKLVNDEIKNLELGVVKPPKFIDIMTDKPVKLEVRVRIPAEEHPTFNFVGKLLGPKGHTLKRLQDTTRTRMSILGKGSQRDKKKEEDLRVEGAEKNAHLNEELHVLVEVFATASEAYNRLAHSLCELRKYLIPDPNDEIRQSQLQELAILNGSYTEVPPGLGRGVVSRGYAGPRGGMSPPGYMGRSGSGSGPSAGVQGRFQSPPQAPQESSRSYSGPGNTQNSTMRGGPGAARSGYQGGFGRSQQQQPSQFSSSRMPQLPGTQPEYESYSPRGGEGYCSSGSSAGFQGVESEENFGPSGFGGHTYNGQNWAESETRMKAPSFMAPQKDIHVKSGQDLRSDTLHETQWILLYASSKQGVVAFITPRGLPAKERDIWESFFRSRLS